MKKNISISRRIIIGIVAVTLFEVIILGVIFLLSGPHPIDFEEARLINVIGFWTTVSFIIVDALLILLILYHFLWKVYKKIIVKVEDTSVDNYVEIIHSNIVEFNDLTSSIVKIFNESSSYTKNITNAIDLVSMGIFFERKASNEVFCTEKVFQILGIEQKDSYIPKAKLDHYIAEIKASSYNEKIDAYKLNDYKWVKLETKVENEIILGIITDVTAQYEDIKKLEKELDYDFLTKIYTRQAFNKKAEDYLKDPDTSVLAIIMWDIDKLKYINDTYGHAAGDKYIKKFAEVISLIKESGGIVSRRSGDEFLGLVPGDNHDEVIEVINKVRNKIYNTTVKFNDDMEEKLRSSMGISWYPDDADNLETLINYADVALYDEKYNITDKLPTFSSDESLINDFEFRYKQEFNRLITGDFTSFAYQAIVSAKDGSIIGYEFLMKLFSDIIEYPLRLISIAKLYNSLHLVEDMTFIRAMECYDLNKEALKDKKIFINSIPNNILTNETIANLSKIYENDLSMLVVEMNDFSDLDLNILEDKFKILEKHNSELCLDNFGGQVKDLSLDNIKVSYLKIDKIIIDNIHSNIYNQKNLKAIIDFSKAKGIKTIAMGVKTENDLAYLINAGIDYLQGYLIGLPSAKLTNISTETVNLIKKYN